MLAAAATVHAERPIATRDVGKVVKWLGEYGLVAVVVAGHAPREGASWAAAFLRSAPQAGRSGQTTPAPYFLSSTGMHSNGYGSREVAFIGQRGLAE